jgi:hypothetical protein
MTSAVGFVLSTRGEVIADHAAKTATRHGWEAKVERDETQLATLGRHRPSTVIKAELASVAVPAHIWRRSHQCSDLTLDVWSGRASQEVSSNWFSVLHQ